MAHRIALYTWHQTLHVIGNPNEINDPETFVLAAQGIAELADCFMFNLALPPIKKRVR